MKNLLNLKQAKADLSRASDKRFISQEEMIRLIGDESGVNLIAVDGVLRALQTLIVERFKIGHDVLIPGIMRIVPGEGGLTRRYIKIQSVSETLKGRLK